MIRPTVVLLGSSALVMTGLLALRASAWGPHPEADAAHAHLVQVIQEIETVERSNPPDSFGGHMGQAGKLARQALEEFDRGVAVRSRLP